MGERAEKEPVVCLVNIPEIDVVMSPHMESLLYAALEVGPWLVVDLSAVQFLDSSGVKVLMHIGRIAQERGGDLVAVSCQPAVSRVLEITGLGGPLGCYDTVLQAREVLLARQR